jgi:hypothetical protein
MRYQAPKILHRGLGFRYQALKILHTLSTMTSSKEWGRQIIDFDRAHSLDPAQLSTLINNLSVEWRDVFVTDASRG